MILSGRSESHQMQRDVGTLSSRCCGGSKGQRPLQASLPQPQVMVKCSQFSGQNKPRPALLRMLLFGPGHLELCSESSGSQDPAESPWLLRFAKIGR